jgi:hypothetical protein
VLLRNRSLHVMGLPRLQQAKLLALLELPKDTCVTATRVPERQHRAAFAENIQQPVRAVLACTLLC